MQWIGSDTQEALSTGDTETVKERSPFWNVMLPNRTGPKFDLKCNAEDNKTRKQSNKPGNVMQWDVITALGWTKRYRWKNKKQANKWSTSSDPNMPPPPAASTQGVPTCTCLVQTLLFSPCAALLQNFSNKYYKLHIIKLKLIQTIRAVRKL